MTKDTAVILEVLRQARHDGVAVWLAADDRIAGNLRAMRELRGKQHGLLFQGRTLLHAHYERSIKNRKIDNRRVRRLVRTYASWQRPAVVHGSGAELALTGMRSASGEGASTFPTGRIGRGVTVSYNGKVWDGSELLFDPYAKPAGGAL